MSPRFFQITSKIKLGVPEIFSNYFENNVNTWGLRDSFKPLHKQTRGVLEILTTSKIRHKGSPRLKESAEAYVSFVFEVV